MRSHLTLCGRLFCHGLHHGPFHGPLRVLPISRKGPSAVLRAHWCLNWALWANILIGSLYSADLYKTSVVCKIYRRNVKGQPCRSATATAPSNWSNRQACCVPVISSSTAFHGSISISLSK